MQTNITLAEESELHRLGKEFIEAGDAYWAKYQTTFGKAAVVWLEMDNGYFLLFSRSEYRGEIMSRIPSLQGESGMEHPFRKK